MGWCCCSRDRRGLSAAALGGASVVIFLPALFANGSNGEHGAGSSGAEAPSAVAEIAPESAATPEEMADPRFVLGYTMPMLDGEPKDLHEYKGRVVLMVNTASRCGLTPQYDGLQKLYEAREERGLVILGFPANNFGNQEPGSDLQIAEFCEENFGVTFPMFSKVSVKGDDTHELYKKLAKIEIEEVGGEPGKRGGPPAWNFTKFLVDRDGLVVARFSPRVAPDDERLIGKIDQLLGADD